jgi:hypothetical protein
MVSMISLFREVADTVPDVVSPSDPAPVRRTSGCDRCGVSSLTNALNGIHQSTKPTATVDGKVYAKFLERMRNRFDIFGTLPDVIDDDRVEDEEELEARSSRI